MKAYDNKTALLKSVLKTVMDPPGGLNSNPVVKRSLSITSPNTGCMVIIQYLQVEVQI